MAHDSVVLVLRGVAEGLGLDGLAAVEADGLAAVEADGLAAVEAASGSVRNASISRFVAADAA